MEKKEQRKIVIQDSNLLVARAQSKRLSALYQQVQNVKAEAMEKPETVLFSGLNKNAADALRKARARIQNRIRQIKQYYPPSQQNKLFTIRYGDFAALQQKSIQDIFALLELDASLKNFDLIAKLDFNGDSTIAGDKKNIRKTWKKHRCR